MNLTTHSARPATTTLRRLGLAIAAIATILTTITPAPAQAGSYDVYNCRTPQGAPAVAGDANYGWKASTTGHSFLAATDDCSTGGFLQARLGAAQPEGARAQWLWLTVPNTTIVSYELYWAGTAVTDHQSWSGDVALWRSDQPDPAYVQRAYGSGSFGNSSAPFSATNRVAESGVSSNYVAAAASCSRWAGGGPYNGCPSPGTVPDGETAMFRIFKSRFTIDEDSAPTVGSVSGDMVDDEVLRGTEAATFNAQDVGSGVYRLIVSVDGEDRLATVINSNGGRCADADTSNANPYEFIYPRPCPLSNSGDVSVDTTQLPEGSHSLRLKIEDAAGNRTTIYGPVTKTVDNVPPAATEPDGDFDGDGTPNAADPDDDGDGTPDDRDPAPFDPAIPGPGNGGSGGQGGAGTPGQPGPQGPVGADGRTPNGTNASAAASLRVKFASSSSRVVKTRYGKRALVTGRLTDPAGKPIGGASLDVLEQARVVRSSLVSAGQTVSESDGTFRYLAPVGPSRLIRFAYKASLQDGEFAQTSDVELKVIAGLTLKPSKRSVRNGQSVAFNGRVLGAPSGSRKVVELQAKIGKRWMTFATTRLRAGGRFAHRYRFVRTSRSRTYSFRARVRQEAGFPFLTGVSKTAKVKVRV